MRTTLIIVSLFLVPALGMAATLNVPGNHARIQDAINTAVNGDTVLVAPGTYFENIAFIGKAITVVSSGGPEATVINGGGKLFSVARFVNNEGPDSVLEGFTLTNGKGTLDGPRMGGGVYCGNCSPTIRSNIIMGNTAEHGGGIGCAWGSSPTIVDNIIVENIVQGSDLSAGGGILCSQSVSAFISGNLIAANIAKGVGSTTIASTGGGIQVSYNSSPTIMGNVLLSNTAEQGGGVWAGADSSAIIKHNVFEKNWAEGGNTANGSSGGGLTVGLNGSVDACCNLFYGNWAKHGGGVCVYLSGNLTFTNNTVWGNQATATAGGVHCYGAGSIATINNSILLGNSAPASMGPELGVGEDGTVYIGYSDVKGGKPDVYVHATGSLSWGSGMIDADPLFADPAAGDLHLTYTSPCKDSGHNMAPALPAKDFEGDPRTAYGTADMGADEFSDHLYCTGDLTPGGSVALKFVGMPGTAQVGLIIGFGVFDPPLPGAYGDWYIKPPMVMLPSLPAIPADGILVLPGTLPGSPPGPYTIYTQAMIGYQLTNLCVMEVE